MQAAVVAAFKHAWSAYKKHAWGHDELKPMTNTYEKWFGLGLTLVDSLDTMYIMGLKEGEFIYTIMTDFMSHTMSVCL